MNPELATSYVCMVNDAQRQALTETLRERGWEFSEVPHAHWKASREKVNVVVYLSGKMTVQGKGTGEFVLYFLEPEILGEARLGYEPPAAAADAEPAAAFSSEPHAGMDESGKGDFFGPLTIAAVFADTAMAAAMRKAGVRDSKLIKSGAKIQSLADDIRRITGGRFAVVPLGPEAYNRLYASFGNLNRLLAWGHARALENLLDRAPECTLAVADKFGDERLIRNALQEKGRKIELRQEVRAEADTVVAAASILARAEFLRRMHRLGEEHGCVLPRGASAEVDRVAAELVARGGAELLGKVAKLHFRTACRALGLPEPEKVPFHRKSSRTT
jgi:ribonuclease HIII